ncbi:MAG: PilZ domain-containing protein [Terriglobales bacterium]
MITSSAARNYWPGDYRKFERFPIEGPLDVSTAEGETFLAWCLDIGEGGLGATISAHLKVGQEVVLNFKLPTARARLNLSAVVKYSRGFWYGLEFLGLNSAQREAIRAYGRSLQNEEGRLRK